jgi:GntR family transcriptional repressor for pyruvate dehydrogenase complex
MPELFTKLEPQRRRFELVADRIQQFIVESRYQAGDSLPTERKLTELLGVSRTVVREAFKVLAQKGLLDIRAGKGAFVTLPKTRAIGELIDLHLSFAKGDAQSKFVEVRRTLEVEIAGLAAQRRQASDLERLEETIQVMIDHRHDQTICNEADLNFHLGLAQSTQNELFGILLGPIRELLFQGMVRVFHVKNATEQAIEHHQAILGWVRARKPEDARRAMEAHLDQFERVLRLANRMSLSGLNQDERSMRLMGRK